MSAVLTSSGHLDASVTTESETYYVEPAERYFTGNVTFPAVIYKASDVVHPEHHECASHQLYLKQFEASLNRKRHRHHSTNQSSCAPPTGNQLLLPSCNRCLRSLFTFCSSVSWPSSDQLIDRTLLSGWHRNKQPLRKQRRSTIDPRKTTCMLYLQADHLFYAKMGSEEACIESMTRHVQRVNSIYKNVGTCNQLL